MHYLTLLLVNMWEGRMQSHNQYPLILPWKSPFAFFFTYSQLPFKVDALFITLINNRLCLMRALLLRSYTSNTKEIKPSSWSTEEETDFISSVRQTERKKEKKVMKESRRWPDSAAFTLSSFKSIMADLLIVKVSCRQRHKALMKANLSITLSVI